MKTERGREEVGTDKEGGSRKGEGGKVTRREPVDGRFARWRRRSPKTRRGVRF